MSQNIMKSTNGHFHFLRLRLNWGAQMDMWYIWYIIKVFWEEPAADHLTNI